MGLFTSSQPAQKIQNTSLFLIAAAAAVALLYYGRTLCITTVIAVILAFILDPFVTFFMRMKLPRPVASFLVCAIALLLVYLAGLAAYSQVTEFYDELPAYSQRVNELTDRVIERLEKAEQNIYRMIAPKRLQKDTVQPQPAPQQSETRRRRRAEPPPPPPAPTVQDVRVVQDRPSLVPYVYSYFSEYYHALLMVSFVPFLVYFMLSWSDHIRKSYLTLFEGTGRIIAGRSWHGVAAIARGYVIGNFILGVFLSVASCLVFWSWHLPYWAAIGVLSGFLSLIPYIGLPLAIAPAIAATLIIYDTLTPFLIISAIVSFFHLLALNLFYPKLVGARVHLNPLAVTLALMFWGTIWGGIGLVLAIPITAGAKVVFDNVESLQGYGKMLGD